MSITAEQVVLASRRWGLEETTVPLAGALAAYGNLLMDWNARMSLTSIREEGQLIERHLLEGLFAAVHHPVAKTSLDFGSGTGIPGIVIALALPKVRVTLAESQLKKASFLREAIRSLDLLAAVHASRAEALPKQSFDAVWMRAVDRSQVMLPLAASLVAPGGRICILTTREKAKEATTTMPTWEFVSAALPPMDHRVLHIGRKM